MAFATLDAAILGVSLDKKNEEIILVTLQSGSPALVHLREPNPDIRSLTPIIPGKPQVTGKKIFRPSEHPLSRCSKKTQQGIEFFDPCSTVFVPLMCWEVYSRMAQPCRI